MRLRFFRLMARANKLLLPKMWHKDLLRLTKLEKLIVAWRIWVTKNSLGDQ